jgi:2-keto-4-pentenoate hydratase/2-oxohepta-3-ene-1,7-dioic acid hydratase in catechol pathway
MRFVNADGRAALLVDGAVHDLERLTGGTVSADPTTALRRQWDAVRDAFAAGAAAGGVPVEQVRLGSPVPEPRAVYAVALNYRAHAAETGRDPGELPGIFAKFPTAVTGPHDDIVLPRERTKVDYEAELAVVFADGGHHVDATAAWDAVLGFTCAQDVSERHVQYAAMGQFAMGKSYDTFCPLGPALVTLDELADPADLAIRCRVDGEVRQDARTSDLIVDIPGLTAFISSVCPLRAGDVCLTGTPSGVGAARGSFLAAGDVVETEIEGLGTMRNRCVAEP